MPKYLNPSVVNTIRPSIVNINWNRIFLNLNVDLKVYIFNENPRKLYYKITFMEYLKKKNN